MKIACLGTSANPPHLGHVEIARRILKNKLVDEIWLIPCYRHAFNKKMLPWKYRWQMIKMLETPKIKACDIESRLKQKSYTINTVLALKKHYQQHTFYWLIGSDIVFSGEYKKWKNWPRLKREIKFIVVKRTGYPLPSKLPRYFINSKTLTHRNISSTEIRRKLSQNLSITALVPKKIAFYLKYLKKNKLLKYKP